MNKAVVDAMVWVIRAKKAMPAPTAMEDRIKACKTPQELEALLSGSRGGEETK
jgi:hypothetical protein